ncbi:MAG: tetratricopeptide repeat protein, partial [Deltaproteobacteria bacterium]|nr:tetratricopeptide repeat protein [Deltaproteobacteria bacterium]
MTSFFCNSLNTIRGLTIALLAMTISCSALNQSQRDSRLQTELEALEMVVERDPEDARAHAYRANSLMQLKRYDQGIEAYRKAIALDPNRAW